VKLKVFFFPLYLFVLLTMIALIGKAHSQTKEVLFDGKTLTGWHTQGTGTWSVSEGRIHAINPQKNWGHLVSEKSYKDGYVRFKFLNVVGNSGLYVRGTESGLYGVKGMQIDIGFAQDGSVMSVTDTNYAWLQIVTKAMDSAYLKAGEWNELAVDVQGAGIKTYINGRLIWVGTNISGIAATGILALQLHSGDNNDIYFKDIELLTPTRIPYCPNPNDVAYKPGNDPDPALCKTTGIQTLANPIASKAWQLNPAWMIINPNSEQVFNLQGRIQP
jgi:hypothetical protein